MLTHFYSWSAWRDIYEPKCHWNIVRTSDQKNIIGIWKYILHGHITDTLFSYSVMSNSLSPHGLQHTRLLCPSPSPRACSNSCPLSWWCHLNISSSVTHFSSGPQSFPASGSLPMSQLFTSGDQSIGALASASVLPMNSPLGLTGLISLSVKRR